MQNFSSYQPQNTCSCKSILISLIETRERELFELKTKLNSLPKEGEHQHLGDLDILKWEGKENSLKALFELLNKKNLILRKYKWEFFKTHFIGSDIIGIAIPWNSAINELVYLIDRFRDEELIGKHPHPHIQLQSHFLDKYNQPLKASVLCSSLDKGIKRKNREELIEEIIEKVIYENNR